MKSDYKCLDCGYKFSGDSRKTDGSYCPKCKGRIIRKKAIVKKA